MKNISTRSTWACARCNNQSADERLSNQHHAARPIAVRAIPLKTLLLALPLLLAFQQALALPNFDPFADATASGGTSYTVGSALTNQFNPALFTPWYGRGTNFPSGGPVTQPMIVVGSLSYPGLPASTGNSASFSPAASMSACLDLNQPAGGQPNMIFCSFLLKITDISAVPTSATNNPIAAFIDDPRTSLGGNQIARLGARLLTEQVTGSTYVLGTSLSATTSDFAYDSTAHNVGDVLFVVQGYQQAAGGATNVYLWINPDSLSFGSSTPPSPTVSATSGKTALNGDGARGFALMCQFPTAPSGVIDDIRLGMDWATVTGGPGIYSPPTNQTFNAGDTATLTVGAFGGTPLSYQWQKNGSPLSNGGNISGATTATLTITSLVPADGALYSVVVSNSYSVATSAAAVLTVIGGDPSISMQPQSVTNVYGTTATFQVTASGTAPFTYQWHEAGVGDLTDGGNISGSQTNTLTLTGVASLDSGTYSVTVSNALGARVDSVPAVLTVEDPGFVTQPVSTTNVSGTTATFHAVAGGTPSLNYVWYRGVNILFDDGVKYSGASTDTLSISNVAAGDQDTYSLTVFNGNGDSESSVPVTLTVVSPPTPITITAQPTPRNVLAGSKTALAVGFTGSDPQFQWQHAGTNLPSGTAAAYVLTDVEPEVTGSYQVIVSNNFNAQTSAPALVTIVSSLHLYPTNVAVICVGDGAEALSTNGNSMFLDQYAPDGTYLTTMSLPDSGPTSLVAIGPTVVPVGANTSVTGNSLSHSANGRFLVIGSYNTNLSFTAGLQSANATTVPRGIAFIDDQAQYTLAISSSDTGSGNFFRGAVADGTNNYWGYSRTASTYYFGFDAPGVHVDSTWNNLRTLNIFNGSIYGVSSVSGKSGVMTLGELPTSAVTLVQVIDTASNYSSDCAVNPAGDLIYIADSRGAGTGGGIQRWDFDSGSSTWNLSYTLTGGVTGGAYYVAADFSGANPVIYEVTTDPDNNQIVQIPDTGPSSTGTVIAYAGANQNFRGIQLGPAATTSTAQPLLSATPAAGAVILNWSGSYFLQSAPVVTGPYQDVINGTRPYTNSTGSASQEFFRLRQ